MRINFYTLSLGLANQALFFNERCAIINTDNELKRLLNKSRGLFVGILFIYWGDLGCCKEKVDEFFQG